MIFYEKSGIDSIDYVYESGNSGIEYLKTTLSNNTLFDRDNFCETPNKNFKYVLLDQCCYDFFVDTRKIDPCLKRKKKVDLRLKRTKKSEPESELEVNEDTVFDE